MYEFSHRLGQTATWRQVHDTSGLASEADIRQPVRHVAEVPDSDIGQVIRLARRRAGEQVGGTSSPGAFAVLSDSVANQRAKA